MSTVTFLRALVCVSCLLAGASACSTAPVKASAGEIDVVVRRIDVLKASYDRMTIAVIVAIANGAPREALASADARVAIVGEAKADGDAKAVDTAGAVAGEWHAGTGGGSAAAGNTSELPIVIELPLPSDPSALEDVLGWHRMLLAIEGTVRVGERAYPIGGQREVTPPRLPEVKLKEAQVASVDGGSAGTGFFTLLLDNRNPFAVSVDKIAWTITIQGKPLEPSSGAASIQDEEVPPSAVIEYPTEVQLDEAAFGTDLKALLKSPSVPYVIDGSLWVRGIERTFQFEGQMHFP